MDLRRRLARLERSVGTHTRKHDETPQLSREFPDFLGLEKRDGVAGPVWIRNEVRSVAPPAHDPSVFFGALTRPIPADLMWNDVLFLDTETTGLAGGTGTVPFLVGLAWWEEDSQLHLRQYMLPGPGSEPAMLAELESFAAGFRLLATYNGHSYDLPLLRTRGILARRRGLLAAHDSWDLLPLARRLWGRRLTDCRQGTVEQHILGLARDGEDIPGARIPQTWIDFVREGTAGPLATVLAHNAWDLEGMAGILTTAAAVCDTAGKGSALADAFCWQDRWSLARLSETRRDRELEADWIRAAIAASPLSVIRLDERFGPPPSFFADAVRMLKRTGDWDAVAALVAGGLCLEPASSWLHREAAILYEHRLPDHLRALGHARRCGEPSRVARLEQRLAASSVAPEFLRS